MQKQKCLFWCHSARLNFRKIMSFFSPKILDSNLMLWWIFVSSKLSCCCFWKIIFFSEVRFFGGEVSFFCLFLMFFAIGFSCSVEARCLGPYPVPGLFMFATWFCLHFTSGSHRQLGRGCVGQVGCAIRAWRNKWKTNTCLLDWWPERYTVSCICKK